MNDTKLTTKNIKTEYSHPDSFLLLRVKGKQTPAAKGTSIRINFNVLQRVWDVLLPTVSEYSPWHFPYKVFRSTDKEID